MAIAFTQKENELLQNILVWFENNNMSGGVYMQTDHQDNLITSIQNKLKADQASEVFSDDSVV